MTAFTDIHVIRCVAISLIVIFLFGGVAVAEERKNHLSKSQISGFHVHPSDVQIPPDVDVGKYRRIIQPFKNWVLICDENLQMQKRICNVTQSIMHERAGDIFSWSLAAKADGHPFMILRVPLIVEQRQKITLNFNDSSLPIIIKIAGCDAKVCIGYLPVGPRMQDYIRKGSSPQISYSVTSGKGTPTSKLEFRAFLEGLSAALEAIEN